MMKDYDMPYFMYNEDWFYYDEEEEIYKLTKKATKEAIESYTEFYKMLENEEKELDKELNISNEN